MALRTLNPYLFVDDAPAAIAWYCSHLGAGETLRVSSSDGSVVVHARLQIGDCVLMLSDVTHDWSEAPAPLTDPRRRTSCSTSKTSTRPRRDASQTAPPSSCPSGTSSGASAWARSAIPFGHVWNLATVTEELSTEEIVERAKAALPG